MASQSHTGRKYKVLLYYKFSPIKNPQQFAQEHRTFCEQHNILGRILVGKEGLNGTCGGTPEDIEKYKEFVHSLSGFEEVWFKEHTLSELPFQKLIIKEREEIITLGEDNLDMTQVGQHISPQEFNTLYEKSKTDDSIVFFDGRNKIESDVGKFKNAITPDIQYFREFKEKLKDYENLKEKTVVTYCTGGIRCEKLSALMIQEGFKDVKQLNGGVYHYLEQFPDGLFQGSCFVFDKRLQVVYDTKGNATTTIPEEKIISHCHFCQQQSNRTVNYEKKLQRHMLVCCEECDKKFDVSRVRYKGEERE